jgi:hypothetical protein
VPAAKHVELAASSAVSQARAEGTGVPSDAWTDTRAFAGASCAAHADCVTPRPPTESIESAVAVAVASLAILLVTLHRRRQTYARRA